MEGAEKKKEEEKKKEKKAEEKKKKEKEKKKNPIIRRHWLKGKKTGRPGCSWRIQHKPPNDSRAYILDKGYDLLRSALIALNTYKKSVEYSTHKVSIIDYPNVAG